MNAFRHYFPPFLFFLAAAASAAAQERISLDGTWDLAPDDRGVAGQYTHRVEVPSAFETVLGTGFDGVAWYRIKLPLDPAKKGARVRVEFLAVATEATIFCNDQQLATHLGGWTPFLVELTDALKWNGDDILTVRVDEKVGHNTQGFLPIIQPHFGGIWQGVRLWIHRGPCLDLHHLFAFGHGDGTLEVRVAALAGSVPHPPTSALVIVRDGATELARGEVAVAPNGTARLRLPCPDAKRWSPWEPHRVDVVIRLVDVRGTTLDEFSRKAGFRDFGARGSEVRWNGIPWQARGILHWGYSPPHLAPPSDPEFWRAQLVAFQRRGFNMLKCCLFVPPPVVYDLCDELGLVVWQEYPTWHPKMDAAHRAELRREYDEFFALDGSHPSVAIRSLTCETGASAELAVLQELFFACHAAIPGTLVVDDSSWIGWQRISDFWDEHPYGNNRWWPGRLQEFEKHQNEKGRKPLLLGECMAADTWFDRAEWKVPATGPTPWWRPLCFEAQERFESWLVKRCGKETFDSLGPQSRAFGLRNRKYQIERLRATIPDAGYVVSVARDFAKARMGLYDDFGTQKWSESEFGWHGDTMISLVTEGDTRVTGSKIDLPVVVSHFGPKPLRGPVNLALSEPLRQGPKTTAPIDLACGQTSAPIRLRGTVPEVQTPTKLRLTATVGAVERGDNSWEIWQIPDLEAPPTGAKAIDHLDAAALDELEGGGRLLLIAGDRKPKPKTEDLWYLKGAPFAPPHPLNAALPADFLLDLTSFDLERGRVIPWAPWDDQVAPILAFWETHDIAEVRAHLLAFETKVGKGRLLVSTLDPSTRAGIHVKNAMLRHLAQGPEPEKALDAATLAALRNALGAARQELPEWKFSIDPEDRGLASGWIKPETDASSWRTLRAGAHWDRQGVEHYDGVAWYRLDLKVDDRFKDVDTRIVFEGIDDSATVYLNGEEVGRFGDPATKKTVWLERSICPLGRKLRSGSMNTITLRVVDHAGAGGLWKPVYLTTGSETPASALLDL